MNAFCKYDDEATYVINLFYLYQVQVRDLYISMPEFLI